MKAGTRGNEQFHNQDMEIDNIVAKFLQGKTILVTGATGFLSKVFVENILRLQPKVNKLYLLLRAQDEISATQRLNDEIMNKKLFKVLCEKWGSEFDHFISNRVIAVAGDISFEDLVKDSTLKETMLKEIEIIVNVAATTDFTERYDVALDINTFGVANVLNFGKKCDKVKLFLHVSTAYVCGEQSGIILEKRFYMGETLNKTTILNIIDEKKIAVEKLNQLQDQCLPDEAIATAMKELGLERAKLNGWPNTYVFTKAMGEMVVGSMNVDFPLVIIRPTMISSTYKQPFPGWIEGVRTIDSVILGYGKGRLTCFPGNLNSALDVIPVDMVVNAMTVAMEVHYANHEYSGETIYHVSSSLQNPMKCSDFRNFLCSYFTKSPWVDGNGEIVKVGRGTVASTAGLFFLCMQLKYVLPLKVLYLINILSCRRFEDVYTELDRKIKFVMRLAKLYKPYVFFSGIFDGRNLEKLEKVAEERGIDVAEFDFNSKHIDWKDYIMNIHIPGLLKHAIKP